MAGPMSSGWAVWLAWGMSTSAVGAATVLPAALVALATACRGGASGASCAGGTVLLSAAGAVSSESYCWRTAAGVPSGGHLPGTTR
eukprot:4341406-Amphidinium_carterae.1